MFLKMMRKVMSRLTYVEPKQLQRNNFMNVAHTQPQPHHCEHTQPQRRDQWLGMHRKVLKRRAA